MELDSVLCLIAGMQEVEEANAGYHRGALERARVQS
jgi:hypothetical protein